MKNLIHIDRDFGWFLGNFDNNQQHRHYAIQLSIPLRGSLTLTTESRSFKTSRPLLIKPNVSHRISSEHEHLLILINPASTIGHFWFQATPGDISELTNEPSEKLQYLASKNRTAADLGMQLNTTVKAYDCFCDSYLHQGDERINKALAYLDKNYHRVIALEEIADHCHISPGRFLHLFKEQTGLTYRRTQLWTKLMHALPLLQQHSLTQAAHMAGFADSAHFSRTFRENFGFPPRELLKISRFIQV